MQHEFPPSNEDLEQDEHQQHDEQLSDTEQPLPDPNPNATDTRPGRKTGPRTPNGKAKSAMNRLTHGCRSKMAVLPHEDPAEYRATIQDWFDQYDPHHHDEITLVQETALAHWHFMRASRRLEDIESHLPGDAWDWTEEQQHQFANFTRYKTTAERSLIRWYRELEAYGGRQMQFEQAQERLRAKIASVELAWLKNREKSLSDEFKVKQFVQVEKQKDDCTTTYYPTNKQILDDIAARPHKPLMIQRLIEFPNGVPSRYGWADPDIMQRTASCSAVQRFFYSDWLKTIKREESSGHVSPIALLRPDLDSADNP